MSIAIFMSARSALDRGTTASAPSDIFACFNVIEYDR